MEHLITKMGKHDRFKKKSFNKKYALPLVTFGKLIQNNTLCKVLRITLALILTIGLIPHTQLLRAYAQDSGLQSANSNGQSQLSSNEQANYALVVENGTTINTEDGTIPAYSLVFTYSENEPEIYGRHEVVAAYKDFLNCAYCAPWDLYSANITEVAFATTVRPQSTTTWFYGCKNLTTINGIEKLDTSNVTNMKYMFNGCSSLTSLDVSGFKTSKVTNMVGMFCGCSRLIYLDVSGFNTSKVVDMCWMFNGCSSLTDLDVSNFNTSNVKYMYSMFSGCSSLTYLDLPNLNISNVTDMEGMFSGNTKLKTIAVRDLWNMNQIDYSSDMFKDCTSLEGSRGTVYDSSKTDGTYAHIDGGEGNPGYFTVSPNVPANYALVVENGTIENTEDGTIQAYRLVFTYSENEPETYGRHEVVAAYKDFLNCAYYAPWDLYSANITEVAFATTVRPQSTTAWFYGCKNLTTITGIKKLDTSNVTNMKYMFNGCSSLTYLDVSGFKTSKVVDMCWMFNGCSRLTYLDVSGFKTSKVTNMAGMFCDCSSLTYLDLYSFNTSKVVDMCWMFNGCSSLTYLGVSGFNTSKVTNMEGMFCGCSRLTKLDLSNFNTSKVKYMYSMFSDCSSLTYLDLSSFNTSKVVDMEGMFSGNTKLETIVTSNLWNMNQIDYSSDMFKDCTSLKGACGTVYDSNYIDKTYARTDGGSNRPGYFSKRK